MVDQGSLNYSPENERICSLKSDHFSREYIFQPSIFRGHVSFQGILIHFRGIQLICKCMANLRNFLYDSEVELTQTVVLPAYRGTTLILYYPLRSTQHVHLVFILHMDCQLSKILYSQRKKMRFLWLDLWLFGFLVVFSF